MISYSTCFLMEAVLPLVHATDIATNYVHYINRLVPEDTLHQGTRGSLYICSKGGAVIHTI